MKLPPVDSGLFRGSATGYADHMTEPVFGRAAGSAGVVLTVRRGADHDRARPARSIPAGAGTAVAGAPRTVGGKWESTPSREGSPTAAPIGAAPDGRELLRSVERWSKIVR